MKIISKLLFLIVIFGSMNTKAESHFFKSCREALDLEQGSDNFLVKNQIKWLQKLYKSTDCKTLKEKLLSAKSFNEIIPSRSFKDFTLQQYRFKSTEFLRTKIDLDISDEWEDSEYLFSDLKLFAEFNNINHINFSNKENSGRDICETLNQMTSISSISLLNFKISDRDISCINQKNIKLYLLGNFVPDSMYDKLIQNIYGIENYEGKIEDLSKYKKLSYLGLQTFTSKSSLKVLTRNRNLKHLHINISNISNPEDVAHLTSLEFLSMNCFQAGFSQVPINLIERKCKDNNLVSIEFIVKLIWLKELDLSWNSIKDATPISRLDRLEKLNLKFNKIETLPNLKDLKKLKFLDLSNNELQSIDGLAYSKKIRFLNLGHNQIRETSRLSNFKNLKYLSLAGNPIESNNFLLPQNLEFLNIEGNSYHQFNKIYEFSMSWLLRGLPEDQNERYWPELLFFEDIGNIYLLAENKKVNSDLSFDVERLKRLKALSISFQNINNPLNLTSLNNLKYLNFSSSYGNTQILFPKNIEYLKLRDNNLKNSHEIEKLENLKILDASYNNFKDKKLFFQSEALSHLKLENCSLNIEPEIKNPKKMVDLNLKNNELVRFNTNYFSKLNLLDLSGNKLKELPDFSSNDEIKQVNLNNNNIESVRNVHTLANTSSKYPSLYLENNQISDLSIFNTISFSDIILHLGGNPIYKKSDSSCPKDSLNLSLNNFCSSF